MADMEDDEPVRPADTGRNMDDDEPVRQANNDRNMENDEPAKQAAYIEGVDHCLVSGQCMEQRPVGETGATMEGMDSSGGWTEVNNTKKRKSRKSSSSDGEDSDDGDGSLETKRACTNHPPSPPQPGHSGRQVLYFPTGTEWDYHKKAQWIVKMASAHMDFDVIVRNGKNTVSITVGSQAAADYLTSEGHEGMKLVPPNPMGKTTKIIIKNCPIISDPIDVCKDPGIIWARQRVVRNIPQPQFIALYRGEVPHTTELRYFGVKTVAPYEEAAQICFKCSRWGHTARQCMGPFRCRYCSRPHDAKECVELLKAGKKIKPCCCNCGGDHNAGAWICSHRPKPQSRTSPSRPRKTTPSGRQNDVHADAPPPKNAWTERDPPVASTVQDATPSPLTHSLEASSSSVLGETTSGDVVEQTGREDGVAAPRGDLIPKPQRRQRAERKGVAMQTEESNHLLATENESLKQQLAKTLQTLEETRQALVRSDKTVQETRQELQESRQELKEFKEEFSAFRREMTAVKENRPADDDMPAGDASLEDFHGGAAGQRKRSAIPQPTKSSGQLAQTMVPKLGAKQAKSGSKVPTSPQDCKTSPGQGSFHPAVNKVGGKLICSKKTAPKHLHNGRP